MQLIIPLISVSQIFKKYPRNRRFFWSLERITLLSFCVLLASCMRQENPDVSSGIRRVPTPSIMANTVEGRWRTADVSCEGRTGSEIYDVSVRDKQIEAVKTIGNLCVERGEISWRATLNSDPIFINDIHSGQVRWGKPDGYREWRDINLTFRSVDQAELIYQNETILLFRENRP